jgi:hypothetical protein
MKIVFHFIIIFLFINSSVDGQTFCENFDSQTITVTDKEHSFNLYGNGNSGFLQNWNVVSGTPSIFKNGFLAGVNAFSGSQYALTGVCDVSSDWSESVSLKYTFQQGNSYNISVAIRNEGVNGTPTPIDIEFVLLENKINYNYNSNTGCSATPAIPSDGQVVHSINAFAQNNWQVIQFNTGILSSDKNHLWIRLKRSSGSPQVTTYFLFDSLCVEKILNNKCYTFEEQAISLSEKEHAFNLYGNGHSGFLSDWHVTSGTPSVYYNGAISGVDAFEGTQYALIGACNSGVNQSEGVSLGYEFLQGKNYEVSMAVRNVPITATAALDVEFILLTDTINFTYNSNTGCTQTPAISSGSPIVYTLDSIIDNSWQVISFPVSPSSDFSHLWLRVKLHSQTNLQTAAFLFDSLCISEITTNGISEHAKSNLRIYPNPANDILNIETDNQNISLHIFDATGNEVTSSRTTSINISHLATGFYFARVTGNGQTVSRKFLKN